VVDLNIDEAGGAADLILGRNCTTFLSPPCVGIAASILR